MSNMGRSRSHIDSRAAERALKRAKSRATATRPPSPPSARQGRFPTRGYVSQRKLANIIMYLSYSLPSIDLLTLSLVEFVPAK